MPNWCENSVIIKHKDQKKLKHLHSAMKKGDFLKTVIPIPEELMDARLSSYGGEDAEIKDKARERMKKKYGYESWYDFCTFNWGTKWDIEVSGSSLEEGVLTASFLSAWSPPIGVYMTLVNQGFDIDADYVEFGMEFAGTYTTDEGEQTYNFDNLPKELDERLGISESLAEFDEEE